MTATAPWQAHVLTLFPEMFPGPLGCSLAGRALERGIWSCRTANLREFGLGRHRAVDDTPFGGGVGMVMRPDVLANALDAQSLPEGCPVIYPTPRGARLSQSHIRRYVAGPGVAVLCGRFEGVDERVLKARGIEEICLGDFILSGGEIAGLALLDACVRLLPGVMGAEMSGIDESFSDGLLEYPHYTRPADWEGHAVPDVLLSGHHGAIATWRAEQSRKATAERRPDLWAAYRMRHQASSTEGAASAEQGS